MPKPIDTTNPLGSIRSDLGLSLADFAKRVGHGRASLKLAESGIRPVTAELARKIALAVAVPAHAIRLRSWSDADRKMYRPKEEANIGHFDDSQPVGLLPEILALYFAMTECGIDPRLGLAALRAQIREAIERFKIDPALFKSAHSELKSALFGTFADWQGNTKPPISSVALAVRKTDAMHRAKKAAENSDVDWATANRKLLTVAQIRLLKRNRVKARLNAPRKP